MSAKLNTPVMYISIVAVFSVLLQPSLTSTRVKDAISSSYITELKSHMSAEKVNDRIVISFVKASPSRAALAAEVNRD